MENVDAALSQIPNLVTVDRGSWIGSNRRLTGVEKSCVDRAEGRGLRDSQRPRNPG